MGFEATKLPHQSFPAQQHTFRLDNTLIATPSCSSLPIPLARLELGECPLTVVDTHTQVGYTRGSGGKLAASRSEVPQLAIIFRCYRLGEQFIGLEKTSKACTTGLHRSVAVLYF